MTEYMEAQVERYDGLLTKTAKRLRDCADRIEREGRWYKDTKSGMTTPVTCAAGVVHEIHTTLMNLPLANLIECAHEGTLRGEERAAAAAERGDGA